ncbi:MAG: RNA methyltransferase [Cyclobacteriaceae bacterium]|nr:RNA methyltransferase [Cyclobacteriaceae bacterium]
MQEKITSPKNDKIKAAVKLQEKSSERKKSGLFIVEGLRELQLALNNDYRISHLFVCAEAGGEKTLEALKLPHDVWIYNTSKEAFSKIAYRENRDGIVAVLYSKSHEITDLNLSKAPLVIVLEAVEKPGNLGAVLRTADAARVDAVVICDPATDVYNPNVIRSGIGCLFSVPVAVCSSDQAIEYFKENGIHIIAAELKASTRYDLIDYHNGVALTFGTEAHGLSPEWIKAADSRIIIPMQGQHDSLNVSTSVAIVVFEACRQRGFLYYK